MALLNWYVRGSEGDSEYARRWWQWTGCLSLCVRMCVYL
jgi:hypothetical protein